MIGSCFYRFCVMWMRDFFFAIRLVSDGSSLSQHSSHFPKNVMYYTVAHIPYCCCFVFASSPPLHWGVFPQLGIFSWVFKYFSYFFKTIFVFYIALTSCRGLFSLSDVDLNSGLVWFDLYRIRVDLNVRVIVLPYLTLD